MSKIIISWGLAALLAAPLSAMAQDAAVVPSEEAPPAADAAVEPASEAAADAPAESAAEPQADTAAVVDEAPATEQAASDSSGTGSAESTESGESETESAAGDGDALKFYVGVERVEATLDLGSDSLEQRYGNDKLDGGFYRARAGIRLAPGIGIEGQGGFLPDDDKASRDVEFKHFYAAYLVTTGTVLDTVEVSARVGYAWIGAKNDGADESFDDISYGVEAALPLRVFSESLPDIRLTAGATVYTQERNERTYGWSYGLRYDFSL